MPISDDPMHIDNVRARHAADSAERAMYRQIGREIDGPQNTHCGQLRRALSDQGHGDSRPNAGGAS